MSMLEDFARGLLGASCPDEVFQDSATATTGIGINGFVYDAHCADVWVVAKFTRDAEHETFTTEVLEWGVVDSGKGYDALAASRVRN